MRTTWLSTQWKAKERQATRKLDPEAFGLACGAFWGLGLFSLTWWLIVLDGPSEKPPAIGKVYRGYTVTPHGSVIGLIWAFCDALIGGLRFAWFYNWLVGRHEAE